jgi:hypothetical protein
MGRKNIITIPNIVRRKYNTYIIGPHPFQW